MAKLTNRWINRFVSILPFEETFFIKKEIPDIKLNKDIIKLNYGSNSPFSSGDILFYKNKRYLYIWFLKNKIKTRKIHIPEGFLMYIAYKKIFSNDGIAVAKKNDKYCVVVIKDKEMVAQILAKNIDEQFLNILKKEYSMDEVEIFNIDSINDFDIDIATLLKFFDSLDIDLSKALQDIYEQLKIPAIVLLVLINVLDFSMYKYVNTVVNNKKEELNRLKNKNKAIKQDFLVLENADKFWKNFANNELRYPNLYTILSTIAKTAIDGNGKINRLRWSGNLIDIWIVSPSISSIVDKLSETGYFQNIKILSTSQYYKDKTKEVGNIEMRVKRKIYVR